jgi:rod shape determining protein RodA
MIQIKTIANKLIKVPISVVALIALVSSIGFLMLYSAAQGSLFPWAAKQMLYFSVFMPVMLIVSIVDIRIFYKYAYLFYCLVLLLLLAVHMLGYTAMGATRWINLGFIKLQPSELMKIAIIFALARYFHDLSFKNIRLSHLIKPVIMLLIPALLIAKQPDLGTAIILVMLGGFMFFIVGVNKWVFIISLGLISIALPFAWTLLHSYQQNRILTFLNPERDPYGAGYNIIQSKIAIGSGGFSGKGFIQGSQSQLQFLPEHQTDFIFTMLSEEWGFLGGLFLLFLYSLLVFYCYIIALNARSIFAKLMALGVCSMFFLHIFINIAMVMGIIPVVGVPLPLMSYGGTMMATMLIGFGLVINVHIHSKVNIHRALKSFI